MVGGYNNQTMINLAEPVAYALVLFIGIIILYVLCKIGGRQDGLE